jgi:hypothetical protein
MADNLPPSSADVPQSGSLNIPEPSGPHRLVIGMLYLTFTLPLDQQLIFMTIDSIRTSQQALLKRYTYCGFGFKGTTITHVD